MMMIFSKHVHVSSLVRFERSRRGQGEEDSYKQLTSGACQVQKKKSLLVGWVLDSGKCGKNYAQYRQQLDLTRKSGVYEVWLSQKEALDKYGESQLKSMVQSGTIQTRRLASDPRFFEFKAVTQKMSTELSGTKGIEIRGGQKSIGNAELAQYSVMDVNQMVSTDFDFDGEGDAAVDGNKKALENDDLAKALKLKITDDKKTKPQEKVSGAIAKLEKMSQIDATDSKAAIKKKMIEFKNVLSKEEHSFLELAQALVDNKVKGPHLGQANMMNAELEKQCTEVGKVLKNSGAKKEEQKKVLLDSFALLNKAKSLKKSLKAKLPKKAKKATEEEEAEDAD
jgi:hypothetical protein